jgi:hypothetical protein
MINLARGPFRKIQEINERYRHPRIQESRTVRTLLLILRIYLLFSVALLIYTFAKSIRGG